MAYALPHIRDTRLPQVLCTTPNPSRRIFSAVFNVNWMLLPWRFSSNQIVVLDDGSLGVVAVSAARGFCSATRQQFNLVSAFLAGQKYICRILIRTRSLTGNFLWGCIYDAKDRNEDSSLPERPTQVALRNGKYIVLPLYPRSRKVVAAGRLNTIPSAYSIPFHQGGRDIHTCHSHPWCDRIVSQICMPLHPTTMMILHSHLVCPGG